MRALRSGREQAIRAAPSRVAWGALLTGLVLTLATSVVSLKLYDRNEDRLLSLRARELGLVLSASVAPIQTQLVSAAELADATGGNVAKFRALVGTAVGAGRQFDSVSLWAAHAGRPTPVAVIGAAPTLSAQRAIDFARSAKTGRLNVIGLLHSPAPSVGYEFSATGVNGGYAVYAESQLPKDRRSKLESNSAFSDLDYAIYLGRSEQAGALLVTSLKSLPIRTRRASDVVPFGSSYLTLLVTPRGSLGGTFFKSLPWIFAIVGALLSLAAALTTERLARRRRGAEQLAAALDEIASENERLYTEQRSIAQTLQHALLPESLPDLSGLQLSAGYVPASSGIEVGGDWYDFVVDRRRVLMIIGDVSGHGLRAATTMAALRHATLAYAAQEAAPASVLAKLSAFVSGEAHDYFATVLCALIDVDARTLKVASAGHLPPLLLEPAGAARFVDVNASPPIGVIGDWTYEEVSFSVLPGAVFVAFTDGLVERRGETLDDGLARLRDAVNAARGSIEELVERLPRELAFGDRRDDTAIVGVQWPR